MPNGLSTVMTVLEGLLPVVLPLLKNAETAELHAIQTQYATNPLISLFLTEALKMVAAE